MQITLKIVYNVTRILQNRCKWFFSKIGGHWKFLWRILITESIYAIEILLAQTFGQKNEKFTNFCRENVQCQDYVIAFARLSQHAEYIYILTYKHTLNPRHLESIKITVRSSKKTFFLVSFTYSETSSKFQFKAGTVFLQLYEN